MALRTRQRVAEVAARLGFVRNAGARRLARTRENTRTTLEQVGIIHLSTTSAPLDAAFLAMMEGAEHELAKLHASLTFARISDPTDWEKVERLSQSASVDGWLVYGPIDDESMARLERGRLPSVILGDHRCTRPVLSVNVDNAAVGRLAVQHLASLGHRRIAYMAGRMIFAHQRQVFDAFREAVQDMGLDNDDRLISNLSRNESVEPPLMWLQNLDPMPTAVFMPDYGVALVLYPLMQHSQAAALKEMSLLACTVTHPALMGQDFSSIDLRMNDIGRYGAQLLHRVVVEEQREISEVRVRPALRQGRSTQPVRSS